MNGIGFAPDPIQQDISLSNIVFRIIYRKEWGWFFTLDCWSWFYKCFFFVLREIIHCKSNYKVLMMKTLNIMRFRQFFTPNAIFSQYDFQPCRGNAYVFELICPIHVLIEKIPNFKILLNILLNIIINT